MIEVQSKAFRRAAALAASVVERRNGLPILDTLLVHPNGKLKITGTDLDMHMSASVDYVGKPTAPFVLNDHRRMRSALSQAGGATIHMRQGDGLQVMAGDLTVEAKNSFDADDFPSTSGALSVDYEAQFGKVQLDLLRRVASAMSREETRYYLNGIYLESIDDWTLRAVATDGHRLVMADMAMPAAKRLDGVIVPRKAVSVLLREFGKADQVDIEVGRRLSNGADGDLAPKPVGKPMIKFDGRIGNIDAQFVTVSIDGKFPDYRRVIPESWERTVEVEANAFRRAVRMIAALSHERWSKPVKLTVGDDQVLVSGLYDTFSGRVAVPAKIAQAAPARKDAKEAFSIGFNGDYLLDILDRLVGDTVTIAMGSPAHPTIFRDGGAANVVTVLMPMRV